MSTKEAIVDNMSTKDAIVDNIHVDNEDNFEGEGREKSASEFILIEI